MFIYMANAVKKNMAEDILEKIGVDLFLKTKTKPSHQVNVVLLKANFKNIFADDQPKYAIMEYIDGRKIISQPTPSEITKYESYLNKSNWGGASKICNYDISKPFLAECYKDCNFAFTFFSERTRESMGLRTIPQDSSNFVLCGFLMMTIAVDTKNQSYLYIDDVCSLGGLGSMLMNLSKNMLAITNIKNLKLTSLDKPIGFYLHFGLKFDKGNKTYIVPEDSPLSYWNYDKTSKSLVFTPQEEMKGKTKFKNNAGFLYNNRSGGPISILPKDKPLSQVSRLKSKTHLLGGPKGKPSQIVKVKTDNDGITMSFKFPETPRDPFVEALIKYEGKKNHDKIEEREDNLRSMKKTTSRKSRRKSFSNSYIKKPSRRVSRKLSLGNNIKLTYNIPKNSKPKSKKIRKRTKSDSQMPKNKSKKRTMSV